MEVSSYFKRYLKNIQPSVASRQRARQLHKTLTERLENDKPYQDIYRGTFLYGSYRRNTAIQPIKDVDVCVVLDLDLNSSETPKPDAVVNRLRRVLERNNYPAKTALQRRSVRIDMSGTTLDVVPVVAVNGLDQPLKIPDRKLGMWVDTNPKSHLEAATELNKANNHRYIPFVKIVKAWYRYQRKGEVRPKPKGFTLESLVAKYQDSDAPSYAEAFVNFLDNLWRDCGTSLELGIFPSVPDLGIPGHNLKLNIKPEEAQVFAKIVKESLENARKAMELEGIEESALAWNAIFGPDFPTRPDTEVKSFSIEEEEEDALPDDIVEIDLPEAPQLGTLKIKAEVAKEENGRLLGIYNSDGKPLDKKLHLCFSVVKTSVEPPYEIHWMVRNYGREAVKANHLTHCSTTKIGEQRWETTAYRGSHTMTCELRRNGLILARAKYIVNIR